MSAKPAKKTSRKTPLRKPSHGKGALQVGNPGNKGGGRPKDEFKELCRQLASGAKTIEQVKEILVDSFHPQFLPALRWATENGYGKATESVEVSGKDGQPIEIGHTIKWGNVEIPI